MDPIIRNFQSGRSALLHLYHTTLAGCIRNIWKYRKANGLNKGLSNKIKVLKFICYLLTPQFWFFPQTHSAYLQEDETIPVSIGNILWFKKRKGYPLVIHNRTKLHTGGNTSPQKSPLEHLPLRCSLLLFVMNHLISVLFLKLFYISSTYYTHF